MSVKASFVQRAKILLFTRVASSADQSQSIDSNTGSGECTSCPVSYTHLTLPTICSV